MLFPSTHKHRVFGSNTAIPISLLTFTFCVIIYLYLNMSLPPSEAPVPSHPNQDYHYEYTVLKGLFLQSEEDTDDSKFDFRKENFGLINRSYPDTSGHEEEEQWRRFERYIQHLNATQKEGESIKVLFLGRHGQGWHNVAETKYGTKEWDCHYAALDGADGLIWSDAHLTPTGSQQALDVHDLWTQQLPRGLPAPETFYVSPLTRTIQTADLTFSNLSLPHSRPYTPLIKELLREALGIHTCDRRSPLSVLQAAYPHLTFEPGFSEQDLLWQPDYREPRSARRYRLAMFLDDVWEHDGGIWISMTAHSGAIASVLEVLGHREFRLETGGVIPVVVRGRRVVGQREVPPWEPSEGPDCKEAREKV
ncbi:hypothetical protein NX059_011925 [Plenodomus lindquistii]|nr:hypothetical protein NX059_011925 [Plenodomus lindquistii]